MSTEPPPLNRFFANTLLGAEASKESVEFLSLLMQSARQGDLCLHHRGRIPLPSHLITEGDDLFPKTPIVKQGDRVYLQKNWVLETVLLQHIERLWRRTRPPFYDPVAFDGALRVAGHLLPEQKGAVQAAFHHPFTLIYGGPGTGKTYVAGWLVRGLIAAWNRTLKQRLHIVLAAPTGKAALHLESAILAQGDLDPIVRCEAMTLHRLLRLQPGSMQLFTGRCIDADIIVVDEASMIDSGLFAHLLESVREDTHLVLLGDPH